MAGKLFSRRNGAACRPNHRPAFRAQVEQLEPRTMMAGNVGPGDAILHWNDVALHCVADSHTFANMKEQLGPTAASRALAIIHTAMYDAINSIKGQYEPYLIKVVGVQGADIDAAVGAAAHDTLKAMYPKQTAVIDQALTSWLAQIPNGKAEDLGIALGKTVAKAILNVRTNDGANATSTYTYQIGEIGHHQPDPVTFEESGVTQSPLSPQWGGVKPFGIPNAAAFYPPPPPELTSDEYTEAYEEVLRLGGDGITTPTKRTPEQTEIGTFWAYDGTQGLCAPPRLYNQIARVIAIQEGNTEYENARLFCMANVAMADAGIVGWGSKYEYDFWRPVVAIRAGEQDGNPDTPGIENWTPLGAPASNETFPNDFTPPFPAYISGHAIFGASLFQTLTRFYGTDDIAFSLTSDEFNGDNTDHNGVPRDEATRHFDSFSQASFENGISRIYLGIHWRFDMEEGIAAGNAIANNIFNRLFQPLARALPAGSPTAGAMLLSDYAKTRAALNIMQLGDGVSRDTVMLKSHVMGRNTVYTVSAHFPAPSIFGRKGVGVQTIYIVNPTLAAQGKLAWLQDFFV